MRLLLSDLSILLPFMRPVQEKLREEFRKKTITETSLADLQVSAFTNQFGLKCIYDFGLHL